MARVEPSGEVSFRLSLLLLALTPGPEAVISTFPSISSKARDDCCCVVHFGSLEGCVG